MAPQSAIAGSAMPSVLIAVLGSAALLSGRASPAQQLLSRPVRTRRIVPVASSLSPRERRLHVNGLRATALQYAAGTSTSAVQLELNHALRRSSQPRRHPIVNAGRAAGCVALGRARRVVRHGNVSAGLTIAIGTLRDLNPTAGLSNSSTSVRGSHELVRECNQLLRVLGDYGHLSEARQLFEAMIAAELHPTQAIPAELVARRVGRGRNAEPVGLGCGGR